MHKNLCHGSSKIIENPLYGYGKPYNDYGLEFYCTDNLEMAKEWGVSKNREFDIPSGLAIEAKDYLLTNFVLDYESFDVIIGYRADDSYFSFAQDFINDTISFRQLNNAMHLGKLGQQFVLKSKTSFDQIKFINYEIATSDDWYAKKMLRDKTARREYFSVCIH